MNPATSISASPWFEYIVLTARNSLSVPLPRYELAAANNLPVYLFHHFNKLLQQQQHRQLVFSQQQWLYQQLIKCNQTNIQQPSRTTVLVPPWELTLSQHSCIRRGSRERLLPGAVAVPAGAPPHLQPPAAVAATPTTNRERRPSTGAPGNLSANDAIGVHHPSRR